jgi:hypothetical protein
LLALALVATACVDPGARLDEFYDNTEPFRLKVVAGPCQGRNDISGDFLMAVATVIRPTSPILFDATYVIDTGVEPWGIELSMTPLAVEGRAPVGDPIVASATVSAEGTFDLDFGSITVKGAANPILPGVDATANLRLSGCTNGFGFSCGTADGEITSPANLPLTGSTFGASAVDEGELSTIEPVALCPE